MFFIFLLFNFVFSTDVQAGFVRVSADACRGALQAVSRRPIVLPEFRRTRKLEAEEVNIVVSEAPRMKRFQEVARAQLGAKFVSFHEGGTNDKGDFFQLIETEKGLAIVAVRDQNVQISNSWTFSDLETAYGESSRLRYSHLVESRNEQEPSSEGAWGAFQEFNAEVAVAMGLPKPVDLGERDLALVLVFENGLGVVLRSVDSKPITRRLGAVLPEHWNWDSAQAQNLEISPGGKMLVFCSGSKFSAILLKGATTGFRGQFDVHDPIRGVHAHTLAVGAAGAREFIPTGGIVIKTKHHVFTFGQTEKGDFDQKESHERWWWAHRFD